MEAISPSRHMYYSRWRCDCSSTNVVTIFSIALRNALRIITPLCSVHKPSDGSVRPVLNELDRSKSTPRCSMSISGAAPVVAWYKVLMNCSSGKSTVTGVGLVCYTLGFLEDTAGRLVHSSEGVLRGRTNSSGPPTMGMANRKRRV